jgi:hypothetical protein
MIHWLLCLLRFHNWVLHYENYSLTVMKCDRCGDLKWEARCK